MATTCRIAPARNRQLDPTAPQPVLVLGATGFIGRRLVNRLCTQGRPVVCMVRKLSDADDLRQSGARLLLGDVTHDASVGRALAESRAATVFHLAGLVRARRAAEFMRINSGGIETIAAACAALAHPPVLVIVSSLAAAGPSAPGQPRLESDAPAPISKYGRSKLAGEDAAAKYAGVVPITIVRPPVVYGPGDRALLEAFRTIARWRVHFVPGWRAGHNRRLSLIHVDDLVEGLLHAASVGSRLLQGGTRGEGVYFVASDDQLTYAELGIAIARALDRRRPAIVRVPGPLLRLIALGGDATAMLGRPPGWINRDKMAEALSGPWTCGADKARSQLEWCPTRTLADGLRKTAQWYREAGWL